jgi:hypothetical protein
MFNNSFFLYIKKNEKLVSFYLCMLIFYFGFLLLISNTNIGFINLHSYYYYLVIFVFIYFFFFYLISYFSYIKDEINYFFILLISFICSFIAIFIINNDISILHHTDDVTFFKTKNNLYAVHQISKISIDNSNFNYYTIVFEAINNIKCTFKETLIKNLYFYDLLPSNTKYNLRNYNVNTLEGYYFDKHYFDLYESKYCYCNLSDKNHFKFFNLSIIEPIFSYDYIILGINVNVTIAILYSIILLISFFILFIYLLIGWYSYISELLVDYFQRNYNLLFNFFFVFSFFYFLFFLNIVFNEFFNSLIIYINNLIATAIKLLYNLIII